MVDGAEIEQRVINALDGLGIDYEVMEIDPDFADTAQFCERYHVPPENTGNAIIVASKKEPKQYAACVVRATARLDVNHTVRRLMGVSKLSFARAEETAALTGMMIGGVTPLALPEGIPLYLDEGLMDRPYVIVGGGSRSTKIKLAPESLRLLPGAEVVSDLVISG